MEGFDRRRTEDACYLTKPFILGGLEASYEAFLVDPCIPYLDSISEGGDHQGVIDSVPIHEVKAANRVT